jgi:protein translocase SecG subunit
MSLYFICLLSFYIIVCVVLIFVIAIQNKKDYNPIIRCNNTNTYWSNNKKKSLEATLNRITKIVACVYILITMVTWFIK